MRAGSTRLDMRSTPQSSRAAQAVRRSRGPSRGAAESGSAGRRRTGCCRPSAEENSCRDYEIVLTEQENDEVGIWKPIRFSDGEASFATAPLMFMPMSRKDATSRRQQGDAAYRGAATR